MNNKHSTDISPGLRRQCTGTLGHDLHVAQGMDQPRDERLVRTKLPAELGRHGLGEHQQPMCLSGLRSVGSSVLGFKLWRRLKLAWGCFEWSSSYHVQSSDLKPCNSKATLALDCAASTRRLQRGPPQTDAIETT